MTPVGLRTISTADTWYFPSHGFGLLGGVWPDLTLWFVVALARNGFATEAAQWLAAVYCDNGGRRGAQHRPGEFAEWFDGGSLTNRGMYLSPWTSAKYLWAVAETVCGLDGYRTSGRPHFAPIVPEGWQWTAGVRVHWGRGPLHLRRRHAPQADLRRHARGLGRGAVPLHLRRARTSATR